MSLEIHTNGLPGPQQGPKMLAVGYWYMSLHLQPAVSR